MKTLSTILIIILGALFFAPVTVNFLDKVIEEDVDNSLVYIHYLEDEIECQKDSIYYIKQEIKTQIKLVKNDSFN